MCTKPSKENCPKPCWLNKYVEKSSLDIYKFIFLATFPLWGSTSRHHLTLSFNPLFTVFCYFGNYLMFFTLILENRSDRLKYWELFLFSLHTLMLWAWHRSGYYPIHHFLCLLLLIELCMLSILLWSILIQNFNFWLKPVSPFFSLHTIMLWAWHQSGYITSFVRCYLLNYIMHD